MTSFLSHILEVLLRTFPLPFRISSLVIILMIVWTAIKFIAINDKVYMMLFSFYVCLDESVWDDKPIDINISLPNHTLSIIPEDRMQQFRIQVCKQVFNL